MAAEPKVFYLDRKGRRTKCSLRDVADLPLSMLVPARKPASYRKQRHLPGRYWFATTGEHVLYESRIELKTLMMLDFDPSVVGVAAQPFALALSDGDFGKTTKLHVPDYLARHARGRDRVIDVKPAPFADKPRNRQVFAATRDACAAAGCGYEVVTDHDPVLLANVEWLAGFRRVPAKLDDVLIPVGDALRGFPSGMAFGELVRRFEPDVREAIVRPVVLHLLWKGALRTDLCAAPLSEGTVVCLDAEGVGAHGA